MKLFQLQNQFLRLLRRISSRRDQPGGGLGDTTLFAHTIEQFLHLAEPGEMVRLLLNQGSDRLTLYVSYKD